jgi:DNA-binding Xre family transcriptional regulator
MMSKVIKLVLIKRDMTAKDLAKILGCSSQNVYALMKKDSWSEDQLRKIGDSLNCDLEIGFRLRDTNEYFSS